MLQHLKIYALLTLVACVIVLGVGVWKFPQVQQGFELFWKDLVARLG